MTQFGVYVIVENSGQVHPLAFDHDNIIGRGVSYGENPEAAIVLPSPAISKKHARIYLDPTTHGWQFEDMSRHGSLLNGEKIGGGQERRGYSYTPGLPTAVPLHHGDQITIGAYRLVFYEKFQADATAEVAIPTPVSARLSMEREETAMPFGSVFETVAVVIVVFLTILILCLCIM